jgi:hypothetical protein
MFEKLKKLTAKDVFKFLGIGILTLVFLSIFFAVLSFVFTGISENFLGRSSPSYDYSAQKSYSNTMRSDIDGLGTANVAEPAAPGMPATAPAESAFEIKTYDARIRSANPESDCQAFLAGVDKSYVQVKNVSSDKDSCSFSFLVKKEKEADFIAYLRTYRLDDLATRIENIKKSYSTVADRVAELQKRLTENDALLASTQAQYDQLWEALKSKSVSADSIDALNRIITNKADLISKFSKERVSIMDEIDALNKAKADYDEQLANVAFSVYFQKYSLFDWQNVKDQWFADFRELGTTFDDTIRNLTVNLVSFLLKALNVAVYLVLGGFILLAGGKALYRMGRRILFGKEKK